MNISKKMRLFLLLLKLVLLALKNLRRFSMKEKIIMWLGWLVAGAEAVINFLSQTTF